MAGTRVIGIGSPFGDDRAGWLVIDALRERGVPGDCELLALDRPGAALVAHLRGADRVVLVDAMRSGAAPGSVHEVDPLQLRGGVGAGLAVHGFGVAEALDLARSLDQLPAELLLLGIEVVDAAADASPSETLPAGVSAAAARIAGWLATGDAGDDARRQHGPAQA